jgi:protein-S-isoprenylcysteine O-methyltransferase Ste14
MRWITEILWVFLLFSELLLLLFRRSGKGKASSRKDNDSLVILWIVIPASFILGSLWADFSGLPMHHWLLSSIGLTLFLFGWIIRRIAILQLGKSFTVDVAIRGDQPLKTDGLYRKVRHPSYSGLLLMVLGIAITMNSLISLLLVMIPIGIALGYRVRVEERALKEAFGDAYSVYSRKTRRLVPGIF